jgi:hypothetical protein
MKVSITYGKNNGKRISSKVIINKSDLWEGDYILSLIIYPFLKKYRSLDLPGYPSSFVKDIANTSEEEEKIAVQEWLNALDKMIFSFECIAKNKSFIKGFKDDIESYERQVEYQKKIREGLEFFGKHFQDLWI